MGAQAIVESVATQDVADQLADFDADPQAFIADLDNRLLRFQEQASRAIRVPRGLRDQEEGMRASKAAFVDNPPFFPYIFDED